MISSSYRPGSWFAVFGSGTTLLLPDSEKSRVAELWSRIDAGAGFDEVLDALLTSGLGALTGFVLVSGGDGPTKLLARGSVVVTGTADGESLRIDGRDALTWVERTLQDVEALSFEVGDAEAEVSDETADAVDLPIIGGLVRVSRVDQPAVRPEPGKSHDISEDISEDVSEVLESSPLDGECDTANMGTRTDPGRLDEPIDPPGESWAPHQIDSPTYIPEPGPAPGMASVPRSPGPPPPPPARWQDDPLSAPLPVESEGEAGVEAPDHDGETRIGDAGEAFSRELPGIPGQQAAPRIVAPVAKLMISNGECVEVDRVVLIGRAPEARRFTSTDQPRLVKVPSPLHEISSTHLEVRPGSGADHGSAVVTDMGSTNGTVIEQPGLGAENLKPGIAVQLIPGATINLGDGVTIQVNRP